MTQHNNFILLDETMRCVARDDCCTPIQKCGPGEGYCTKNEECETGTCGPIGSCNTTVCSENMGTCFSNTGRCCIKGKSNELMMISYVVGLFARCHLKGSEMTRGNIISSK